MDVDRIEDEDSYFPAITPLIDVVLLVLIFFIVTASFAEVPEELDLTLPEAATSDGESPAQSNLYVTAEGRFRFDGNWHDRESLIEALQQFREGSQGQPVLLISADRGSSHQHVVSAIGAAREAGIADIGFEILLQGGTP